MPWVASRMPNLGSSMPIHWTSSSASLASWACVLDVSQPAYKQLARLYVAKPPLLVHPLDGLEDAPRKIAGLSQHALVVTVHLIHLVGYAYIHQH